MSRGKGYGNGITQDVLSIFRTNGAAFGSGLCERGRANSDLTWTFNPIQPTLRSLSQFLSSPAEFMTRL